MPRTDEDLVERALEGHTASIARLISRLENRGADAHLSLRDAAARQLQKMLGLRSKIEIVAPGTFARTDFKARRVIDDREVFRDMNARLRS